MRSAGYEIKSLFDADLAPALDSAVRALIHDAPEAPLLAGVRKWINSERAAEPMVFDLACALLAGLHLFTPGLSGRRPIDRAARQAEAKGGVEARAMKALAASKFAIFHVERFDAGGLATARDCVTGAGFRLVDDGLDPSIASFDVATRLCPLGGDVFWAMGPFVPIGPHSEDRGRQFPSRPGKGLINEGAVAAQIYREYVRAGAPLGGDFGRNRDDVILSFVDDELAAYAEAMQALSAGAAPTGEMLAWLRSLAILPRLAMALSCAVELAAGGAESGAAIYRAAARVILDVVLERARIGSGLAPQWAALRDKVAACFTSGPMPPAAVAMLDELLAETGARVSGAAARDESLVRVIERIRALRLKTVEMGCTEQEALGAAEKVAELLDRYGLSLTEVELRRQTCEGFGFDTGRKQTTPIDDCLHAAAEFCDCRMWSETNPDGYMRQVVFGLPADVEAARCLRDLVVAAFETETETFRRAQAYRDETSSGRKAMVKSFQVGLGSGISRKLANLKAAREKAWSGSTGRDLTVVKRSLVDEEMDKLGLRFSQKRQRRKRVVADAYNLGVAASHRFEVNDKIE